MKKAEYLVAEKVATMDCRLAAKMDAHWVVNLDLQMAALTVDTKAAHSAEKWGKCWVALKVDSKVDSRAAMKDWKSADSSDEEKGSKMAA